MTYTNRLTKLLNDHLRMKEPDADQAISIIKEFIDLLDVLQIEVMHPRMNGEHQFTVRGTHGCLTNSQWRLVYEARECRE